MPGKIIRINFRDGDRVHEGESVMVMEAMKMEQTIRSPKDGFVQGMSHEVGDVINEATTLFVVEDSSAQSLVKD